MAEILFLVLRREKASVPRRFDTMSTSARADTGPHERYPFIPLQKCKVPKNVSCTRAFSRLWVHICTSKNAYSA